MISGPAIRGTLAVLAIVCGFALAQEPPAGAANREPLNDAWFTGPILAPSAATLPRGHFLIEPYFYDVTVQGRYDNNGARRSGSHENDVRSLTYMLYGLSDKVTVNSPAGVRAVMVF